MFVMHLQVKACLLILLIGGHEGARMYTHVNIAGHLARKGVHTVTEDLKTDVGSKAIDCNVDMHVEAQGPMLLVGDHVRAVRRSYIGAFEVGDVGTVDKYGESAEGERRVQVTWKKTGKWTTFPTSQWWHHFSLLNDVTREVDDMSAIPRYLLLGEKHNVRVPKGALASPLVVGRKIKNACVVTYSLLCKNDEITLRQEVAPCRQQTKVCKSCGAGPTGLREDTFGFFIQWHTIETGENESPFKFDESFNMRYTRGPLPKSLKVQFTPSSQTCESTHAELKGQEKTLTNALRNLEEIENGRDFKSRTAMLKPFLNDKILYDDMGCGSNVAPAITENFINKTVTHLRAIFVKFRKFDVTEDAAGRNFDAVFQYMTKHRSNTTLKQVAQAAGVFFGTDVNTKGLGSEDVTPETEQRLENALTQATNGALLQVNEGQLANRRRNPINDFARFILIAFVFVTLCVIFAKVIFVMIIAAVVFAVGIGTWAQIKALNEAPHLALPYGK